MSIWTYIRGIIEVCPFGRTQAEDEYILKTVLSHLPKVTGSENDMCFDIVQSKCYCTARRSTDEFGNSSNLANRDGWFDIQSTYFVVVYGDFRDRYFKETFLEFEKWIERLSKRVLVTNVLVKLDGFQKYGLQKSYVFTDDNHRYSNMLEGSGNNEYPRLTTKRSLIRSVNWCDYLMWDERRRDVLERIRRDKYN